MSKLTFKAQLLFVLSISLLVSVASISIYFIANRDALLDEYEKEYLDLSAGKTLAIIKSIPAEQRALFLDTASNRDVSYSLSAEPVATSPVNEPSRRLLFGSLDQSDDIRMVENHMDAFEMVSFFSTDQERKCFELRAAPTEIGSCPWRVVSMRLDTGEWVNVITRIIGGQLFLALPIAIVISIAMGLVGFLLLAFREVRRITRPLEELNNASRMIGRGEYGEDLKTTGPLEIQIVTSTFNTMKNRINNFITDRTNMLGAISHDLKTPITSLRLKVELIESDEEIKASMIQTIEEMQSMVEACLAFAKNENVESNLEKIDIVKELTQLSTEFSDCTFSTPISELEFITNKINLKRAIRNIIENAIRYGDSANVTLSFDDERINIDVQDKGPGISPLDTSRIFDPFVRLDESRNISSGSVGLGLSIAKSLIQKMGGNIEVSSTSDGATFRVQLPRTE